MYLKRLAIKDIGPIESFDMAMPFDEAGFPLPVALVGQNGSGKTNMLSVIGDALFEIASLHFNNVTATLDSQSRPYFRVLGGMSTRLGATGSAAALTFSDHENADITYVEKAGDMQITSFLEASGTPRGVARQFDAAEDFKKVLASQKRVGKIFSEGAYAYFPSSRSEAPSWLNSASVNEVAFDIASVFTGQMRNPIFVERGIEPLKQWLASLLTDVRADTVPAWGNPDVQVAANKEHLFHRPFWESMNAMLREIVSDQSARFVWFGRRTPHKIGFARGDKALTLSALSAGQSTLLNIFGTLARYGDTVGTSGLSTIEGICLIDEVDAHIHVELQSKTLPALIAMFPKVQFIITCHSPLFLLGMENKIGAGKTSIIQMPSGTVIQAEQYSEFEAALEAISNTKSFHAEVLKIAKTDDEKSIVFLEGETDPIYFTEAAKLRGYTDLLDKVEFHWIGAKDPRNGQGFHTGKESLNSSVSFLRANPSQIKRKMIFLYDNDANKPDLSEGQLHVRSVPTNTDNHLILAGIENLLPEAAISEAAFDVKEVRKPNGTFVSTKTLNKSRLCNALCYNQPNAENFANFDAMFDMLRGLTTPPALAVSAADVE